MVKQKFYMGDIVVSKKGTICKVIGLNITERRIDVRVEVIEAKNSYTRFRVGVRYTRNQVHFKLKTYTDKDLLEKINNDLLDILIEENTVNRVRTLDRSLKFSSKGLKIGCQNINPDDALTIAESILKIWG